MSVRNYVPIDVDDLPEQFDYDIDGQTYILRVDYNEQGDFFTVGIATEDEDWIVKNWKMFLNRPLFESVVDERLPATALVPMDESNQVKRISITNFGDTVFLYEDTLDSDIDPNELMPVDSDNQGDD
ncbi:phage baseplate plug family protein [Apilactobacillus xinyiensis]|uniref:phage baseplate plug family protein n=1 Tax=Apilactobacillus xinyiensis TaxID=2841032 RepID=UPI003364C00D